VILICDRVYLVLESSCFGDRQSRGLVEVVDMILLCLIFLLLVRLVFYVGSLESVSWWMVSLIEVVSVDSTLPEDYS